MIDAFTTGTWHEHGFWLSQGLTAWDMSKNGPEGCMALRNARKCRVLKIAWFGEYVEPGGCMAWKNA